MGTSSALYLDTAQPAVLYFSSTQFLGFSVLFCLVSPCTSNLCFCFSLPGFGLLPLTHSLASCLPRTSCFLSPCWVPGICRVAQSGAGPRDWHPCWVCLTQGGAHPCYGNGSTWPWASRAERKYSRRKDAEGQLQGGQGGRRPAFCSPVPGSPFPHSVTGGPSCSPRLCASHCLWEEAFSRPRTWLWSCFGGSWCF